MYEVTCNNKLMKETPDLDLALRVASQWQNAQILQDGKPLDGFSYTPATVKFSGRIFQNGLEVSKIDAIMDCGEYIDSWDTEEEAIQELLQYAWEEPETHTISLQKGGVEIAIMCFDYDAKLVTVGMRAFTVEYVEDENGNYLETKIEEL